MTTNYAGIMGNWGGWPKICRIYLNRIFPGLLSPPFIWTSMTGRCHDLLSKEYRCKSAGNHRKAPFTRQSRLFPKRQKYQGFLWAACPKALPYMLLKLVARWMWNLWSLKRGLSQDAGDLEWFGHCAGAWAHSGSEHDLQRPCQGC